MNHQDRFELVKYRITKARETLDEVKLHIEHSLWNTAVNRLYYACYYAVTALLIHNDIKAHTHSGVRQMFSLHFVKPGIVEKSLARFYSDIFDMRQTGDYDDFIDYSEEDVLSLTEPANQLITQIENILKK